MKQDTNKTGNSKATNEKDSERMKAETYSLEKGQSKTIPASDIDFSPFNYRKYYSEEALESFAAELAIHGIISPLTVRQKPDGRYELVVGERRLRAARMVHLKQIPVVIQQLTDEEVQEIQLAENLQRENPHPMHEAYAIGRMQERKMTNDEIAARLGKSRQFVYVRTKLLSLHENFQEMFLADKITISEAVEIASLSPQSQSAFYNEQCSKWKTDKRFRLYNLDYYLNQYKCDLTKAPFNIRDKKLLPEAGACINCPFNTATLKSLFPELAKQAVCNKRECYAKKCSTHFQVSVKQAFDELQPKAIIKHGWISAELEAAIKLLTETKNLSLHGPDEVSILTAPEKPDRRAYTYEDDEGKVKLDEKEFKQAMEEYQEEAEDYKTRLKSGKYQTGLLISGNTFQSVLFDPDASPETVNGSKVTARQVQEAIKSNKATPQLLKAETDRILEREKRSKEIDREKVQLKIHEQFGEYIKDIRNNKKLTPADLVAARLLIYQSLDYNGRQEVNAALFTDKSYINNPDKFYTALAKLTDQKYSYLIRMAIAAKSDSKYPNGITSLTLYNVAKNAGLNVAGIENEQKEKAKERALKIGKRIEELNKEIKKMKKAA